MSGDDYLNKSEIRARQGFTLVESMLAVLILALLACAATLSLSRPLADAEAREAYSLLSSSDHWARQVARDSAQPVRLIIDPAASTIARYEGTASRQRRALSAIPRGCHVRAVRLAHGSWSDQPTTIEFSASGYAQSYAVHLRARHDDEYLVFAGMTGQITTVSDEATADAMLGAKHTPSQGGATRDDAD